MAGRRLHRDHARPAARPRPPGGRPQARADRRDDPNGRHGVGRTRNENRGQPHHQGEGTEDDVQNQVHVVHSDPANRLDQRTFDSEAELLERFTR